MHDYIFSEKFKAPIYLLISPNISAYLLQAAGCCNRLLVEVLLNLEWLKWNNAEKNAVSAGDPSES